MDIPDAAPPSPCRVRRDGKVYVATFVDKDVLICDADDGEEPFMIMAGNWVVTHPDDGDGFALIANVCRGEELRDFYEVIPDDDSR